MAGTTGPVRPTAATGNGPAALTDGRYESHEYDVVVKLGGAALVASALGLIGAGRADADEITTEGKARRRCNRRGGDFCKHKGKCKICCGEGRRRRKACCGSEGCNCCRRGQTCRSNGRCD